VIAPDSSVVIAAIAPWHLAHRPARAALVGASLLSADRRAQPTYEAMGIDALFLDVG
jgi:hypothetical protein